MQGAPLVSVLCSRAMPIIKEDPLRRYDPNDFSFKSVKGEVSEAMQFDWKRDKVDDAKKRAIYDSKSYDEFKDRVAGCTLKPIHRNEFNAPPKYSFNNRQDRDTGGVEQPSGAASQDATKLASMRQAASGRSGYGESGGAIFVEKVPKNGHEFERELRRRPTSEDKVRLLELVLEKSGLVARLFSRELDGEMLRQVLSSLEDVLIRGTAAKGIARRFFVALATDCPDSITGAVAFFDAEERRTLARLLARDPASDPGEDVRVCAAFGIPPSSVAEAAATLPPPAEESVTEQATVEDRPACRTDEAAVEVRSSAAQDGYEGMD